MSSILKALRKLEEERARRREAAPEIATSILRGDARRNLLPLWLWPAVVASAMLLAAAAFWGLRPTPHTLDNRNAAATTASATAAAPAIAAAAPRAVSGDVIVEEIIDTRTPATPIAPAVSVAAVRRASPTSVAPSGQTKPVSQTLSSSAVTTSSSVATTPPAATPSVSATMNPVAPPSAHPPQTTIALPAAHSNPVVSAIAWQEDRASRMAVVSGLPVMEGELVGTAKIEEIQVDRVVFSENGLSFSVPMKGE